MTLEEKIEHLRTAAMEDARAEGNEIIQMHKTSIDQIFEDHKEIALRQAELSVKTASDHANQQLNKAMATEQTAIKRAQSRCQHQLKTKLFARIEVLLKEYMQTPEYSELLVRYISKAKAFINNPNSKVTIYINESDAHLKETLESITGYTLTISKEDFIGGTRTVVHDDNILIDRSFSSALAEEYDNFLFSGGDLNA